ncbi:Crp/Fnr family transcriptional regulator [Adhaeribacter pallidiroseus]|uniref:Non-specific serine/threonine protein kinase n=1 Tax=Adhaeribacter pallidiroseus TaxID=2072847 RepID=A0A369QEC0_9BACT|nr:Crp/Fnr family transcriptional regulator [Adhaeribacter pallidiroseus]RDC62772.1 Non-specific serine/threonine protein kinase [Adhaeribacter pallidiroseus]
MAEKLLQHLQKFIVVPAEAKPLVAGSLLPFQVKKKQNLLENGQICTYNYFVEKGCLRLFFINDKGIEQTTQFSIENWWLSDYSSFSRQQPSTFFIQAVENTTVWALSWQAQEQLFLNFPPLERYFRLVYQRAYAAEQWRIKYIYDFSKEEMYQHFSSHYPGFVQRIPQYLLASFLGFTPEYLSEIRKKSIS